MTPAAKADRAGAAHGAPGPLVAITAAGASQRMGRPKPLLPWNGSTLLAVMVDTVGRAGLPRPAVVIGASRDAVLKEVLRSGAHPLDNPDFTAGRFSSIGVAARWALAAAAAPPGLLLWPVDCPGVSSQTLRRLAEEHRRHPDADVVPRCRGRGGHPVVLCRQTLATIADGPADGNLRELIGRAGGGRRVVEVDDLAVLDNLNTPEEYEAFSRRVDRGAPPRRSHG